jgi:hypothetical protein
MITVVPPNLGGDDQLAVAPGDMEQRHRHEVADGLAVLEADHPLARLRIGQEVLVGGHGALREARGAARVEDGGQVLLAEVVDHHRGAVGHVDTRLEDVRGARVGDHVLDLAVAEAGVHGHGHGARHLDAEKGESPRIAVAEADGDAIATLDAGLTQATGDPCGTVPHVLVAEAFAAQLDEGLALRVGLDGVP